MSRKKFAAAKREAIWRAHDRRCVYTQEQIDFENLHIDHIVPEHLANNAEKLDEVLRSYGLPADFDLNDFANLLPAKAGANLRKGGELFSPERARFCLHIAEKKKTSAEERLKSLKGASTRSRALLYVERAIESGHLVPEDLRNLERRIEEWGQDYVELDQRLADERESAETLQARVLLEEGRLEEAGSTLDSLIAAGQEDVADAQKTLASHYLSRAQIYSLQFKWLDALAYYERAYQLQPEAVDIAPLYARALLLQRRYSEAERIYLEVLPRARERAAPAEAGESSVLARVLSDLGVLYYETRRFKEAEATLLEALELSRALNEDFRPSFTAALTNLALLYQQTHRFEEAEATLRQGLEVRRTVASTESTGDASAVARTLHNLAALYLSTDQLGEAESTNREALQIFATLISGTLYLTGITLQEHYTTSERFFAKPGATWTLWAPATKQ
jgi:tetratricopeptide (TPR) repeat protein